MKHFIMVDRYENEGDIYQFYSFEEAVTYDVENECWMDFVHKFERYRGCKYVEKKDSIYGKPICNEYEIIGIEYNCPYSEYYWILLGTNGERRYVLGTNVFYENIVMK